MCTSQSEYINDEEVLYGNSSVWKLLLKKYSNTLDVIKYPRVPSLSHMTQLKVVSAGGKPSKMFDKGIDTQKKT